METAQKELHITTAEEYKRSVGFSTAQDWAQASEQSSAQPRPLTLPSGAKIMVRHRSAVSNSLKGAEALDTLAATALAAINGATSKDADTQPGAAALRNTSAFILKTIVDHVIEPRIVLPPETPGAGEILLTDIRDDRDLMAIFFDATGQIVPSVNWGAPDQIPAQHSGKVSGVRARRTGKRSKQ